MHHLLRPLRAFVLLAICAAAAAAAAPDNETRLLRFPATNGRDIVFSYAGELYTVGLDGGTARRLTSGPGYAMFPRFSADGAQLAFTAQYDGNTEVYVMPASGGAPKRLTYTATLGRDDVSDRMGPNNLVMAWKNKSAEIAFRTRMRSYNDFIGQLFTVGLDADLPKQLPVPRGGFLSFSPDDTKIAYNRVFREFRTWKRYRGGQADDIWIYDLKTGTLEDITNNPAQDIIPMWGPNGRIYFLSDRDGHLNLYSYDLATKQTAQHTQFKDFDVKFPSMGGGKIVFEQAGRIWVFDLASASAKAVSIAVQEDFVGSREKLVNVAKFAVSAAPSPDGKRAVVVARGDVFSVPAKDGPTRNLTQTSAAHERDATWSPDGKWIAYIGDATGENELYVRTQDGRDAPMQLTKDADTYYYRPHWSPDSKKLLWSDRLQRLRIVDIATKAVTEVDHDPVFEVRQYAWSPDSKWVAWSRPEDDTLERVFLYSLDSAKKFPVTDGWYAANSPSFSADGKFLFFASSRDFKPTFGATEFNHIYRNMERVYVAVLAKDTESPLKPRSDEVEIAKADAAKADAATDDKAEKADKAEKGDKGEKKDGAKHTDAKKPVVVKVDEDGLSDRVVGLPITAANYGSIQSVGDKVYYVRSGDEEDDEEAPTPGGPARTLAVYDFKERKETVLGKVAAFEITADGKKMLVKTGKDFAIVDVPGAKLEVKDKLDLSGLEMRLDPRAEWTQIYNECWRQMRDFFYNPKMNGVDWSVQRAKYAALLPYVQHRNDLTYIIGELIGELNNGHAYVGGGGARPEVPRIAMGLLGAELSRDTATRAYRIDKVLRGENWGHEARSPLTDIGVKVSEGDYILAVNGQPVAAMENIYQSLIGLADKQVVLSVNAKPVVDGAHDVTVVPVADEAPLYYYNWVQHNIEYVAAKTGGKVGYIHIPDMGQAGLNEFVKHFYPQLRKKALIIDDRGNGGGNVSPQIVERLQRELVMVEVARNSTPQTNPGGMQLGPKVLLLDEFSASDGDIFPFRFKTLGLGKLIGKRSWGGVVGIREPLPLMDGGFFSRPEFAPYAKDGKSWVIESHGVDPDIVVDNDPAKEFHGEDQQLDRAIDEALTELKTHEQTLPPPPPWPDRS